MESGAVQDAVALVRGEGRALDVDYIGVVDGGASAGGGVCMEYGTGDCGHTSRGVVQGCSGAREIAGESASANGQVALVSDSAAMDSASIARESATSQSCGAVVSEGTAASGTVVGEEGIGDRGQGEIVHGTASTGSIGRKGAGADGDGASIHDGAAARGGVGAERRPLNGHLVNVVDGTAALCACVANESSIVDGGLALDVVDGAAGTREIGRESRSLDGDGAVVIGDAAAASSYPVVLELGIADGGQTSVVKAAASAGGVAC